MRIFCLLLIVLPCWASAQPGVLQQEVSMVAEGEPLDTVLGRISDACHVYFSYSADVVPVDVKVTFTADRMVLGRVLEQLLGPYAVAYKVSGRRIILRKAPPPLTQTVRGVVVDQGTHQPVPGASVFIDAHPVRGGTTDAEGMFRIAAVPVGRATIRVTSVGYSPCVLSNLLLGTGKELVLEINLSETLTTMDEVVVRAAPGDGPLERETDAISGRTFSVEDTKRYAGSLGDPARMAASFAGVTGASDESNALIVRGNSPRGVLWRIEGIEVPNPNHFATEGSSNGVISLLSANMINASDFLTGAFPAWYGNALSAVLDMKLRTGNNARREHSFQAGLLGLEASTEGPFRSGSSSYLVNYRYSTLNILDRLGVDLNDAGELKDYQDIAFKLDFPSAGNGRLSIFGLGGLSRSSQNNATVRDRYHSNMGVFGATYQRALARRAWLTASLSWSGTDISNSSRALGVSQDTIEVRQSYGKSYARGALRLEKKITDHFFFQGGAIYTRLFYNFYLRNLDPDNPLYAVIINFQERSHTDIAQAFIAAGQHLSQNVSLQYGLHYLSLALTSDRSLEPRASVRWTVDAGHTLRLGYGKHSRIENLQYYLARDHQAGGNEVQVNKDLGFTRADHYVAGYDRSLGGGHMLHLDLYYQRLYNAPVQSNATAVYATLNEDSGFITDTLLNKGKGRNYGVEVSIERGLTRGFYYMVNGSLYQSQFRSAGEADRHTAYNGNYNVHLLTGKEFKLKKDGAVLGLNIRVTGAGGRRYVPIDLVKSMEMGQTVYAWEHAFEPRLPDYFRTDFQIVYSSNHRRYATSWRLDIQNVTNHVNAAYRYYDVAAMREKTKYQVGVLPILSYRIEF